MHLIRIFVGVLFSTNVEWKPQSKGEQMAKTRESSSPTEQKTRVAKNQPTQEQIALRAYHIFLERGGVPGHELEDWTEAERQLVGDNGVDQNGNGKTSENGKPRRKATAKTATA
jgi:Protein of unknown function (DUF2934)